MKSKRPPRRYARLRQSARRFDFDATEEARETIVFLPLKDHEFKWLKKLARLHRTSLGWKSTAPSRPISRAPAIRRSSC